MIMHYRVASQRYRGQRRQKQFVHLIYVQKWMNETKLKMNPEKTEFIYFGNRQHLEKCSSNIIEVCGDNIKKSESVKYPGGYLDKNLNFQEHIRKKCSIAMANFVKIRKIHQYLSSKACHTLVLGLVMSHLDYANGLLCNSPKNTTQPYQRIQNMRAKLILSRSKYDSSSDALKELHWLPVQARVDYKIPSFMHQCTHGTAPTYLKETLKSQKWRESYVVHQVILTMWCHTTRTRHLVTDHLASMALLSGTNYQPLRKGSQTMKHSKRNAKNINLQRISIYKILQTLDLRNFVKCR